VSTRTITSVLACAVAGALQLSQPRLASAEPPCTGVLDGHVVDALTHQPVAGATVGAGDRAPQRTDASGHFLVTGLCPGELSLTVERPEYALDERTVVITGATSVEVELVHLGEVIAIEDEAPEPENMRATAVVTGEALERTRGRAFAEAVAAVPGVSLLRSGSSLAKPIIRGQYGRRLALLVDGVRHRAQEWGLDHAPEVDPFVAGKVSVVRGAAGVQYGPDAVGGALVVEPPPLLRAPGLTAEGHLVGTSNGLGGTVAGRVRGAPAAVPGLAWMVEGTARRTASPVTPDYPLDNTGSREWSAGASLGYRTATFEHRVAYRRYQAQLGVCRCLRIESIDDFYAQLDREKPLGVEHYEREFSIERPYQGIAHDLALARSQWKGWSLGTVTATYAFQHDLRREYDVVRQATTGAQFNFRLSTHDADLALDHRSIHLSDHWHLRGRTGVVATVQTHRYTGLPLVPDHDALALGAYAIERLVGHDLELEVGARYDVLTRTVALDRQDFLRMVRSDQLAPGACEDDSADPVRCGSVFHALSASLGALARITRQASVKLDLTTTSRPPSPDEQYLNGTSPTLPVYGLGAPALRPETTYAASLTGAVATESLAAEASVYGSRVDDYIYFAPAIGPDGNPIFDVLIRGTFPRFTTRATDATFWGADGGVEWTPVRALTLAAQASLVRGRDEDTGGYLAFVPADRVRATLTARAPDGAGLHDTFVSVTGTFVAAQTRYDPRADLAPPPDAYFLLGAEAGTKIRTGDHLLSIALSGTNLTNARYRDYTSLLRYFADEPGWQVLLRLSFHMSPPPT